MKTLHSFLALLTLCAAGATWTADGAKPNLWWRQPNFTIRTDTGNHLPGHVIVDNLGDTNHSILAVGIVDLQDGRYAWAAFTEKGAARYNPATNSFAADHPLCIYRNIDELRPDLRKLAKVPAIKIPEPIYDDISSGDESDKVVDEDKKDDASSSSDEESDETGSDDEADKENVKSEPRSFIGSAIDFITGKPFLITVSASTCAAIATFYATDWYNNAIVKEKTEQKIDRKHAAAIAWISTAVIFGGYFYSTAEVIQP